ncbi:MAG TPA: succinate dehydrogenase/fumarate reductase flavoprotein subunit, partial [Dehalococcoidia bacterium]|nr:succinate dehydrogenase/fumarate reductase flavoprotein subunit [Dehalococcoidia bacterium]
MYPHYIEESVRKVEATREARLKETLPRLSVDAKTPLLQRFHPDYVAGTMRPLAIGPNKGDSTPNEIADLLEGNSRIDPDKIDLSRVDFDV